MLFTQRAGIHFPDFRGHFSFSARNVIAGFSCVKPARFYRPNRRPRRNLFFHKPLLDLLASPLAPCNQLNFLELLFRCVNVTRVVSNATSNLASFRPLLGDHIHNTTESAAARSGNTRKKTLAFGCIDDTEQETVAKVVPEH